MTPEQRKLVRKINENFKDSEPLVALVTEEMEKTGERDGKIQAIADAALDGAIAEMERITATVACQMEIHQWAIVLEALDRAVSAHRHLRTLCSQERDT